MGQMEHFLSVSWDYVNFSPTSVLLAKGHHPLCLVERKKSLSLALPPKYSVLGQCPMTQTTHNCANCTLFKNTPQVCPASVGVGVHTYNPSTREAEAGVFLRV